MPSAPDPSVPASAAPEVPAAESASESEDRGMGAVGGPRVTLLGKPGCHLCEAARAVVATVTAELGESFEEISILDRPELLSRYAEEIPVTLVDGRQHDYWRVDPARLRAALARPRP